MALTILDVSIDRKDYGGRPVLADLRFLASAGEVLALLAPSGTGKTTALRIVLGSDQAFVGAIRRPTGRVGAVFQDPRLLPWMTVADNIRLGIPSLNDAQVEELLDFVELRTLAGAMPRELSLGMSRRVAIARALAVRPSLLILDEPFASLDARLATLISKRVADRSREHDAVVVFASHSLDQALAIADRILVLSTGSPATLAADLPAAACRSDDLRRRFPFLSAES